MYKLKEMAKRGTSLVAAVSLLGGITASAFPALASADALNPLTERSLTLSSSSPGWSYTDGSGNTTYAPPNSGANGKKTGNTFEFKVSSPTSTIKAFDFQYCTAPAGQCMAPGNNGWTGTAPAMTRNGDTTSTSDLRVVTSSPTEINATNWPIIQARTSSPGITSDLYANTPDHDDSEGNFVVLVNGARSTAGWTMAAANKEESGTAGNGTGTGKENYITVKSTTGESLNTGDSVKIIFFGTDGNYITNPGLGAFFVKINDYSSDTTLDSTTLKDGGVTVANVMNESISIQTKVLETMDFSVGTHDPDTYTDAQLAAKSIPAHGQCSPLLMKDPLSATYATDPHNVLKLGNPIAEYSLETGTAYDVNSYWRLSSNSSGGATVYYTGHTLTNTVGDEIAPLDDTTDHSSITGTEQFGLGIAHAGVGNYAVSGDSYGTIGTSGDFADYVSNNAKAHLPKLAPLAPAAHYGGGTGTIASGGTAKFAFNSNADSFAIPIASESTDVVDCVTAKMRYVANIAATTPAGIYTTKINYVASPQY